MSNAFFRQWSSRVSNCLIALALCGMIAPPVVGETQKERLARAEQLVQHALTCETQGDVRRRNELLAEALTIAPDYEPARWHSGQLKLGRNWVTPTDVIAQVDDDNRFDAYEVKRGETEDTPDAQYDLAKWCDGRGLDAQARAHLTRVVELDTDHAAARAALGFRRVGSAWVDTHELDENRKRAAELRRNLAQWRPKAAQIVRGLSNRSQHRRDAAREELLAIRQAEAIPALETAMALHSEPVSLLLVEAFGAMTDHEATLALARQGVASPWEATRAAATNALKTRSEDVFVPALLSELFTPVQSRTELYRGRGRSMVYRHVFYSEGQVQRQLSTFNTTYKRRAAPGNDGRATQAVALAHAAEQARQREAAVAVANARTQAVNDRVCALLASTTGEDLPAQPQAWWDWWNAYNEVYVSGPKPTNETHQEETIKLADSSGFSSGPGGLMSTGGGSLGTMDCLAEGTLVWTAAGPIAIEKIKIGDLVLAQDPSTGEVALKPVLRTTERPPCKLVTLKVGKETFAASGGHPFWVSGHGWTKARDLQYAVELHQLDGIARLDDVGEGQVAPTYNLVVADFHSYFIGQARILSHDNTVREVTSATVPGLLRD